VGDGVGVSKSFRGGVKLTLPVGGVDNFLYPFLETIRDWATTIVDTQAVMKK